MLVAGTIFVLGRMRSHNIVMRAIAKVPDPHTKPVLWLWWASPVAVLLLAGHVLELLVAFSAIKRYPGLLIDSIGLTLLFGFLHWLPLRKGGATQ